MENLDCYTKQIIVSMIEQMKVNDYIQLHYKFSKVLKELSSMFNDDDYYACEGDSFYLGYFDVECNYNWFAEKYDYLD